MFSNRLVFILFPANISFQRQLFIFCFINNIIFWVLLKVAYLKHPQLIEITRETSSLWGVGNKITDLCLVHFTKKVFGENTITNVNNFLFFFSNFTTKKLMFFHFFQALFHFSIASLGRRRLGSQLFNFIP